MVKFVLKTKISRRVFYFVDILNRIEDIFLSGSLQVFSLLILRFRDFFKSHKSPIQRRDSLIINSIDNFIWEI